MNKNSYSIKNEKGLYHSEEGPAVCLVGVSRFWYLEGIMMEFDVWLQHIRFMRGDKHAQLMMLKWSGK